MLQFLRVFLLQMALRPRKTVATYQKRAIHTDPERDVSAALLVADNGSFEVTE